MTLSADRAIDVVRALAKEHGVDADPMVLADKSNLVLHLARTPIVARVAMATSMVRVGMEWLRRETEISRFLTERGGAVTRPSTRIESGPFERAGFVISFWELEHIVAQCAEPGPAGAALGELHGLLSTYPRDRLPLWGSVIEAREVFARARERDATSGASFFDAGDLRRLDAAWERAERIVDEAIHRTASFRAVHGDAHSGNVLATARGPVWTDWEDAFVGPVEYDIACLRSKADLLGEDVTSIDAMTRAYEQPYDIELARDLGLVRNLQVIAWLAIFAKRQPELLPRMRARIACVR